METEKLTKKTLFRPKTTLLICRIQKHRSIKIKDLKGSCFSCQMILGQAHNLVHVLLCNVFDQNEIKSLIMV